MTTDVSPQQLANAPSPMLVTLSGIVIEVRPLQSANAPSAIFFVPSLTTIVVLSGIMPM